MRRWMAGLAGCLAVQGCTPPPSGYYGAPPGYAPRPYAVTPGAIAPEPPAESAAPPESADPLGSAAPRESAAPPDDAVQANSDPGAAYGGYVQPGYPVPAYPVPALGYYSYSAPPQPYSYVPPPPPFLPPLGFYGARDRFDRERYERERLERERGRQQFGREQLGREQFRREQFERSRVRDRPELNQPPQPIPARVLQGPARPQDFRRPPEGPGRRGLTPEQLRQLR